MVCQPFFELHITFEVQRICPMQTRHFDRIALQNGIDVKTVSSMLGHFDAGFTLRTYTHVTRQMQESAAEKMGNFMAQVMRKNSKNIESGGEDDTIILSAALCTFPRVGHGVGQAVLTPENSNK